MRFLLYILSFFILLTCPANKKEQAGLNMSECTSEITRQGDNNLTESHFPGGTPIISSAQITFTLLEESSTLTIAGRQHNDGRNHSAKKIPFKFLKNGKIIDGHRISVLMDKISVSSGILSKDRYLFVIRELRI